MFQSKIKSLILSTLLFGVIGFTFAQAPIDGFYPNKGEGAVALSASFENYEQFFLGTGEESNWAGDYQTIAMGLYGTYGITDNFSAAISLPYIRINTVNFSNEEVNRDGLQDLAVYAKYRVLNKKWGGLQVSVSPAVGFSTPLTNYVVDFYGVGQGATALDLRAIVMATWSKGFFAELQGAGLVRFDPAPSGSQLNVKAGYYNAKVYTDVFFGMQNISGGADLPVLETEDFKALGVSYTRVGVTVAYNITPALGIYAGGALTLDGENVGKANRISGGAVLRF